MTETKKNRKGEEPGESEDGEGYEEAKVTKGNIEGARRNMRSEDRMLVEGGVETERGSKFMTGKKEGREEENERGWKYERKRKKLKKKGGPKKEYRW